MYVDSGATETVMSENMLMIVALIEGMAMRQGVTYEVVNGIRTANLGEGEFERVTEDGGVKKITAQGGEGKKGGVTKKTCNLETFKGGITTIDWFRDLKVTDQDTPKFALNVFENNADDGEFWDQMDKSEEDMSPESKAMRHMLIKE